MQLPNMSTILAAAALFSTAAQAGYETNKAIQVNFNSDTACTSYAGEMAFWHQGGFPYVGYNAPFDKFSDGACWNFKQPKGTQSLKLVAAWGKDGAEWPNSWAECDFYDDWGCKGEKAYSSGSCLAARSNNRWQWKSARCSIFKEAPHSGSSWPQ